MRSSDSSQPTIRGKDEDLYARNKWVLMEQSVPMTSSESGADDGDVESGSPSDWIRTVQAPREAMVPLTFALRQNNLAELEEKLLQISDPDSKDYQAYLSDEQIRKIISPSSEAKERVEEFLERHGVAKSSYSQHHDFLSVRVPVTVAERMLQTKFSVFMHKHLPNRTVVRAHTSYWLPELVAEHVEFVAGTIRLPRFSSYDAFSQDIRRQPQEDVGASASRGRVLSEMAYSCPNCTISQATISSIRSAYHIPEPEEFIKRHGPPHPRNKQAIASFFGLTYDDADIRDYFVANQKPVPPFPVRKGVSAIVVDDEPSLDVQTILSVAPQIPTEVWQYDGLQDNSKPKSESNQEVRLLQIFLVGRLDLTRDFSLS